MSAPLLELDSLEKRFGDTRAVDGVSLSVAAGEIVALVGENGAGKTTLLSLLTGLYRPDAGQIRVDGRPLPLGHPRDAENAGIGLVPQHSELVGPLTVAENAVLGREPRLGPWIDRALAEREVRAVAEKHGLTVDPTARADTLSVSGKQRAEIVKLLWRGARLLALDEPTATLAPAEIDALLDTLAALARDGRGILLVSHKLREVQRVATRIAVLRRGRLAAVLPGNVRIEEVARAMSQGEDLPAALPVKPAPRTTEALGLQRVTARGHRRQLAIEGLSLSVAAGEIVGIAGVDGNGQRELVDVIVGIEPIASGSLRLGGIDCTAATIAARRRRGLAYVPEDRLLGGLCAELSSEENLALGRTALLGWHGLLSRRKLRAHAEELIAAADVRPPTPSLLCGGLSGGNQQKLLLARELDAQRALIVAAHPTRGLDPRAADQVRRALLAQAAGGAGAIVVSQDLDELRALSHRVVVLYRGRIVADLNADEATDGQLSRAMLGGQPAA